MSKLDTSGLSPNEVKILEELNDVTIKKLVSADNATLSDPSKNGKKGGKSRSDAKLSAVRENGAKSQLFKDSNFQSEMGKRGGKKGGKVMGNIVRKCSHCNTKIKGASYFQHIILCEQIMNVLPELVQKHNNGMSFRKLENEYNINRTFISKYIKNYG